MKTRDGDSVIKPGTAIKVVNRVLCTVSVVREENPMILNKDIKVFFLC